MDRKKQTRLMETKRGQGCNLSIRQLEFKPRLQEMQKKQPKAQ